jgi:hypothetical protein
MASGYSPRVVWQLRMQRKVSSDYEKQLQRPGRRMAIVAAVAAIHVVLVFSFLSWHGEGHPLALLVKVKLIPASAAMVPSKK